MTCPRLPASRRVPALPLALALAGAVLLASACAPPDREEHSASPASGRLGGGPYDPKNDPLVNPASMFVPRPADPAAVAWNEVLRRNLDGNPKSLNPIFISSTYEFYLAGALFTGLFTFDRNMKWMLNDDVTLSVEEAEDHLSHVVRMRPGMTWHDGHPFTAHDICWTFYQVLDPRVPAIAVRSGTDQIKDCEVIDDLTLRFVHLEALPTAKWNMLFSPLPKHLYEKDLADNPDMESGDYYNRLNRAPVGNGPYKFVEWLDNERIVVERWDGWWGERQAFRRMVFRIIPDSNTLLLSFNKGDVDEMRLLPKPFATQALPGTDFERVGGVKVLSPEWSYSYIGWNMDGSNPFFSDVRVRRAMTHATNARRMIRDLAYNLYEPGRGIFHPEAEMYHPDIQPLEYDPARAAALLDEAGWRVDEARDGWRHRVINGRPVRFEFTILVPQGSEIARDMAVILQEDLRRIGVSMNPQVLEWATFMERTRKHEFQAATAAWGTGTDPDTLWNLWHSESYDPEGLAGRNYVGFSSPRVDELFRLGRQEFDHETRMGHYREIHRLIWEEQPYTWLWYRANLWGIHGRISGVQTSPRGVFNFSPAESAWWVAAAGAPVATAQTP